MGTADIKFHIFFTANMFFLRWWWWCLMILTNLSTKCDIIFLFKKNQVTHVNISIYSMPNPLLSRRNKWDVKEISFVICLSWGCPCALARRATWTVVLLDVSFSFITSVLCLCMMMILSAQITSRLFLSVGEKRLEMLVWLSSWFRAGVLCLHSSLNQQVLTGSEPHTQSETHKQLSLQHPQWYIIWGGFEERRHFHGC